MPGAAISLRLTAYRPISKVLLCLFYKGENRLREVTNLTQATQRTRGWLNGHWNPDVSGFKTHTLSMILCPLWREHSGGDSSLGPFPRMCDLGRVI